MFVYVFIKCCMCLHVVVKNVHSGMCTHIITKCCCVSVGAMACKILVTTCVAKYMCVHDDASVFENV
jgi:hypothetical protein